jgi:DinB superfamily
VARMTDAQAEEYRQPVLDMIGRDDPLEVQEAEVAAWRELIDRAGGDLRNRPSPGEWSVIECLGHLADSELVTSARYRWVLAEPEPPLQGWDQEAWADRLDHSHDDPATLLALLAALRQANVALWKRTPPQDRARFGVHAERGPESFELLFRLQAGHGRVHRDQAERALAEARRGR